MKNTLKDKILSGQKTVGTFHGLGSMTAVELLGYGGMDYMVVDTEHGPFEVERAQEFIRAANGVGLTPLVRVKDSQRNSILRMLDVGAMGLIIPNVESADEVREIVKYGKYYPIGQRGVAPASGTQYWTQDYAQQGMEHYFEHCNANQLIIPQCETLGSLEAIEEIVAIDGVDGIFVGPFDLSTNMGKPGQLGDPEVKAALQRVLDACKNAGKLAFIYAANPEIGSQFLKQGYDSITLSMDPMIFLDAVKATVAAVDR